jgi:hypothetical protein
VRLWPLRRAWDGNSGSLFNGEIRQVCVDNVVQLQWHRNESWQRCARSIIAAASGFEGGVLVELRVAVGAFCRVGQHVARLSGGQQIRRQQW